MTNDYVQLIASALTSRKVIDVASPGNIRFLDFSRGSARETRGRYLRMHHWLNAQTIQERVRLLDEIIRILTGTIETLKRTPDTRHSSLADSRSTKNPPSTNHDT